MRKKVWSFYLPEVLVSLLKLGYPCNAVEDLTAYPSILGGRVKTLHPKIFGGILCRRGLEEDIQQIEKYEIPEIDSGDCRSLSI